MRITKIMRVLCALVMLVPNIVWSSDLTAVWSAESSNRPPRSLMVARSKYADASMEQMNADSAASVGRGDQIVIGKDLRLGMSLPEAMGLLGFPSGSQVPEGSAAEKVWLNYPTLGLSIGSARGSTVLEAIAVHVDFKGQLANGLRIGAPFTVVVAQYGMPSSLTPERVVYPNKGLTFYFENQKVIGAELHLVETAQLTARESLEADEDKQKGEPESAKPATATQIQQQRTSSGITADAELSPPVAIAENKAVHVTVTGFEESENIGGKAAPDGMKFVIVDTRWENIHPRQKVDKDRLEGKRDVTLGAGGLGWGGGRSKPKEYVEKDVAYQIPRLFDHAFLVADGLAYGLHRATDRIEGGMSRESGFGLARQGETREARFVYAVPDDAKHLAFQFFDFSYGNVILPIRGETEEARKASFTALAESKTDRLDLVINSIEFRSSYQGRQAPNGWHFAVTGLGGESLLGTADSGSILQIRSRDYTWVRTGHGHLYYNAASTTAEDGMLRFTPDIPAYQEVAFLVPEDVQDLDLGLRLENDVVWLRMTEGGLVVPTPLASLRDGDDIDVYVYGVRSEGGRQIVDFGIQSLTKQGIEIRTRPQFVLATEHSKVSFAGKETQGLDHRPPDPFIVPPNTYLRFELAYTTDDEPTSILFRGRKSEAQLVLSSVETSEVIVDKAPKAGSEHELDSSGGVLAKAENEAVRVSLFGIEVMDEIAGQAAEDGTKFVIFDTRWENILKEPKRQPPWASRGLKSFGQTAPGIEIAFLEDPKGHLFLESSRQDRTAISPVTGQLEPSLTGPEFKLSKYGNKASAKVAFAVPEEKLESVAMLLVDPNYGDIRIDLRDFISPAVSEQEKTEDVDKPTPAEVRAVLKAKSLSESPILSELTIDRSPQVMPAREEDACVHKADIVFLIDGTDSMGNEVTVVKKGLSAFVDELEKQHVDARFAIVMFGGAPEIVLDFTKDHGKVQDALSKISVYHSVAGFQENHNVNPEAGLEAIRTALNAGSEPLHHKFVGADGRLHYRSDARINLILVTDEDSDRPYHRGNRLPSQKSEDPPGTIKSTDWQAEVDRTAAVVIRKRAFVNLLISPSDTPSTKQYGDPSSDVAGSDFLNFDRKVTLAALLSGGAAKSLQAQVLSADLVGRSFDIRRLEQPEFINNFYAAKVDEIVKHCLKNDPIPKGPGHLSVAATRDVLIGKHPTQIELILDASGSMRERKRKIDGRLKIDVAKEVMHELAEGLPDGIEVALRVYGHRIREGRKGDCQDTELLVPFGKLDKADLHEKISGMRALGTTPLTYSLLKAREDFSTAPGEKILILVTDGKEECDMDPAFAARTLVGEGLKVRIDVVGFALAEQKTKADMREVAAITGGRFYDAQDRAQLLSALRKATALPFSVFDSKGKRVATGTTGEGGIELMEGVYKVKVDIPGRPPRTFEDVRVAYRQYTRLELHADDGKVEPRTHGPQKRETIERLEIAGEPMRHAVAVAEDAKWGASLRETPDGLRVEQVSVGSLASKANLKLEDLLTDIDGKPLRHEIDFRRVMQQVRSGERAVATVGIRRGADAISVELRRGSKMTWATPADDKSVVDHSDRVRNAQRWLAQTGFKPGPADGAWGRKTETALRGFQRWYPRQKLKDTGRLDQQTYRALESAADSGLKKTPTSRSSRSTASTEQRRKEVERRRLEQQRRAAEEAQRRQEETLQKGINIFRGIFGK